MSRVIVVGSGIAGLMFALHADRDHEVTIVTKDALGDGNTRRAQGGISGALFDDDTVEAHIADTVSAGAGLCDDEAVSVLCSEGPQRIRDLAAAGVDFDRDGDAFARGLEAAHSAPRVVHAGGDATGRAIAKTLVQRVRERRIPVLENTMLVDLVTDGGTVIGADLLTPEGPRRMLSDTTVLATGGCGQLYAQTTNPLGATGDGVAAALRAGAQIADAEFYQFHPTALAGSGFLISEAVRGAGAVLRDAAGRRFMLDVDPRAELAPRNVVALGIARAMAAQNEQPVRLDATTVSDLAARFPTITAAVSQAGFDWSREPIPVTPAAHYWMGGIATDSEGHSTVAGLVAIGEAAHTGVHGANRLASNSLLEGAVFAQRAAAALPRSVELQHPSGSGSGSVSGSAPPCLTPRVDRRELQHLAWSALGLERGEQPLTNAIVQLDSWDAASGPSDLHRDGIELRNLLLIARVIARQALARRESRGAHARRDYPNTDPTQARSVVTTAPVAAPAITPAEEALAC